MRFLDLTLAGLAANLALDEALLEAAEAGEWPPSLRVWELPAPAVVLGASCRLRQEVHLDACRADGVPIGRRSSGGGTVVIGPGALNFAVVVRRDADPEFAAVDRAQHLVLDRTAAAIRAEGPRVEVRGSGDLALAGRKVAGSAQRRLREFFLVHATILYDFPLDRISRYTPLPPRQPAYRAGRSHADFVTNLPLPRGRLVAALLRAWPADAHTVAVPEARVRRLLAEKFGRPEWVERL